MVWFGFSNIPAYFLLYVVHAATFDIILMKKATISEVIEAPVVSSVHDDTTANRTMPPVESSGSILRIESLEC